MLAPLPGSLSVLGRGRGGGAPAFDPTAIAGLAAWYKADSLSLSLSLSDGAAVATWADSGGSGGYAAAQSSSGRRPTYASSGINGRPAVRFAASASQYLALAGNPLAGAPAGDVFAVVRLVDDPPSEGYGGFWGWNPSSSTSFIPLGTTIYDGTGTTTRRAFGDSHASFATPRIYHVHSEPGLWEARLDGVLLTSDSTNTVQWTADVPLLGTDQTQFPFLNGWFGDIVAYGVALTTLQWGQINTYLTAKYGL